MEGLYRKVSGTFLIKILGLGIAFFFQIIVGRVLEPQLYGQYTMFLTYTNLFSIIAVLGMDRNLIKEVAKVSDNKVQSGSLLIFSLKISLFLFSILSVLAIIFHGSLSIESNMLHFFILMLFTNAIIVILDGFLQGVGLVVKVTLLNIFLNNLLKIILFFTLINMGLKGLYSALYSFIVSEIITIMLRISIINKLFEGHISLKYNLSTVQKKQFLKYSITMALISGMGMLLQNIDKIMIANLLDFRSVGIYKVAQNYLTLIGVFITPFVAFWPIISKLYNENKISEIEFEMKKIIKIITYLVIPMFFIFIFQSEKLLLLFGKAYVSEDAKRVLIFLASAFLIDTLSGPIGSILTMTKYAKYILINNVISLILNIVLNLFFIRMFGIVGVAIGTGISIIVNNLISIIEVKVLLGIFSYDYRYVAQIVLLSTFNYVVSEIMINVLSIHNIYLYLVVFGILMYLLNGIVLFWYYRKSILNKYRKRR